MPACTREGEPDLHGRVEWISEPSSPAGTGMAFGGVRAAPDPNGSRGIRMSEGAGKYQGRARALPTAQVGESGPRSRAAYPSPQSQRDSA
jgi:hypothetical protein